MVEVRVNEKTFNLLERRRTENRVVFEVDGREIELETLPVQGIDPSRAILVRVGSRWLMCKKMVGLDAKSTSNLVWVNDRPLHVELVPEGAALSPTRTVRSQGPVTVEAPMSGRIVEVKAAPGVEMKEGQSLVVLEAMKMENEIAAPRDGRVKEVHVKVGSLVRPGDKLVILD